MERDDERTGAGGPASGNDGEVDGEVIVVKVSGEAAVADVLTAAETTVDPAGGNVLVDLSEVTYLAMEAVVPLMKIARRCFDHGRLLVVRASVPARQKLLRLGVTGVVRLEPAFPKPAGDGGA
ncbi:anti-sigma factor antagonist [Amycolatopsis sp., V23-08]|uniref:Anti-sigma factor antagonist n=1 Tax=Amycolatopsis heterodermiae TaxID=3110235 RepID=A0ABU5R281_9PSEU|nr:anti-sigma factor antagonist [Amycolatopsis sp., V23-08]MEA5360298.1 anti-sigma factor antagonist [Amycolatopsis sp., V23-08]